MPDFHFYQPRQGHGLPHDPFKAIVAPRPIGWISSRDATGRVNLAPYSFFSAYCDSPPIVGFTSYGPKHSASNAAASGEFVCNLASRDLLEQMNQTSFPYAAGVDEMEPTKLTAAACEVVNVPRVAEAAAALECRYIETISIRDASGNATPNLLVLGEVVGVHLRRDCLRDGLFDITLARTIARAGYMDYVETDQTFSLRRPEKP